MCEHVLACGDVRQEDAVEVDVDDLIAEWTTEGDKSDTPIVLTKEMHTDKDTDMDDRNGDHWKDVLKADVRIAPDKEHNILKKTADGRNLYVEGTADNIFFKDGKNVKEAIEGIKTEVSSAYTGNIIFKDYAINGDYNGIAAKVDAEYIKETNTLVFVHSDSNGQIVRKEFKLNSAAFINDITYDTVNEKITIRYKDEDGNYCGGYCEDLDGLKAHESRNVYGYTENFHGTDVEVYLRPFTDEE